MGTDRNPIYSPSGIKTHRNDIKTPQYLVEFFYPADQVRVTGGVLKEYIICNRKHKLITSLYRCISLWDQVKIIQSVTTLSGAAVCSVAELDWIMLRGVSNVLTTPVA